MKKHLRLLSAQLFAALLVLTTFSGPARAATVDSDPQLAAEWQTAWDTYKFYENTPPLPGSGRSRAQESISITIDAPVAQVFPAYSNVNNHLGMHSFLKRVVTHKDCITAGKRHIDFTAVEEIPYEGSIVVSNTHAQQRINYASLSYETDTWSQPNVVTHQKIVFEKLSGGKTKVTEYLTFDADTTLIDFVVAGGVASHQATQAGLKQAIENGTI
ncbi:SRPBCC family protein [Streptosporangium sp. NPDC048865]|uniref:SRPBCC family protein n=1 Tax=Streptosporangium sp. NPDC048865 TaxID=3155766 RepID=UPI003430872E